MQSAIQNPPQKEWSVPEGRRFTLSFAALLALVIGLSYSNSFKIGFYFDDAVGIVDNPAIRSLRNIPSFFIDLHALTFPDLRPILLCSYAVNYAISGLNPWSYHLLNVLLHWIAALLVFFIVRDHLWWPAAERGPTGAGRLLAAAAALFFALAPLNTQPVDYIWARSALLCTTFYLGAFLACLSRRLKLGSTLLALALLTKAIAVTLPAILVVYDFLYRDRIRHPTLGAYLSDSKRLLLPVGLPVLLCVCYVAYRAVFLPPWTVAARTDVGITPLIWFMSEWSALLYYVRLFVWPTGLSADHDFPYTHSFFSPRAYLSLLCLAAWLALALRGAKKRPLAAFATAWFFITLAPESSFAPLTEVVNDHRPYIASSLGLSVLLVLALDWGASWFGARRRAAFVALTTALCLAAVPAIRRRNWEWQDSLRLWESTLRSSPDNGRAWLNAGVSYMGHGDLAKARVYFERARQISPGYAYIPMNLSILDMAEGRFDEALREAETAVSEQPSMSSTRSILGESFEKLGRGEEAAAAYRRAVELDPSNAQAIEGLARLEKKGFDEEAAIMTEGLAALFQEKNPVRAQGLFRKVLERNPAHYGATFQLAVALDASGQGRLAHPFWEKALTMAELYHDQETENRARLRLKTGP
jgi:tetratricopeptide (TPR) repeat protein